MSRFISFASETRRFFVKLPRVSTTPRIALVAGATGLVGGLLLKTLLDAPDYTRVYALTRRPFGKEHPRLANAWWCSNA